MQGFVLIVCMLEDRFSACKFSQVAAVDEIVNFVNGQDVAVHFEILLNFFVSIPSQGVIVTHVVLNIRRVVQHFWLTWVHYHRARS
jgi:hypothetical protein